MTITDLINKTYFYTKTNANSLPTANMLLLLNNAYERVASLIMKSDGIWEYDDSNQVDLPIATTALVNGQKDYTLYTDHIAIERVEMLNPDGVTWRLLKPIDMHEIERQSLESYKGVPGTPVEYDKVGETIFLYPTPNYSQAASLKLYFQRAPILFTGADVTAGTKIPGFNSLYHDLIPLWASYDYAIANQMPNAGGLLAEIQRKEMALQEDYSRRNKDVKPGLRPRREDTR
jgi:hypothetical protein